MIFNLQKKIIDDFTNLIKYKQYDKHHIRDKDGNNTRRYFMINLNLPLPG